MVAPALPAAAENPLRVARRWRGNVSAGRMKVVELGPKLEKKKVRPARRREEVSAVHQSWSSSMDGECSRRGQSRAVPRPVPSKGGTVAEEEEDGQVGETTEGEADAEEEQRHHCEALHLHHAPAKPVHLPGEREVSLHSARG